MEQIYNCTLLWCYVEAHEQSNAQAQWSISSNAHKLSGAHCYDQCRAMHIALISAQSSTAHVQRIISSYACKLSSKYCLISARSSTTHCYESVHCLAMHINLISAQSGNAHCYDPNDEQSRYAHCYYLSNAQWVLKSNRRKLSDAIISAKIQSNWYTICKINLVLWP